MERLIKILKQFLLEKRARYLIKKNSEIRHDSQDLKIYWDPEFFEGSKGWGSGTAWTEIQLLLAGCRGRTLDIACGAGEVMLILNKRGYALDSRYYNM